MAASDDLLAQKAQELREDQQPVFETRASDALLDQRAEQAQVQLTNTLDIAVKRNPDRAAEAKKLSSQFGLDILTVEKNQDKLSQAARVRELGSLLRQSPVLARQLSDPAFAMLAHDDVGTLKEIENTVGATAAFLMGADANRTLPNAVKRAYFESSRMSAGAFRAITETAAPALDFLEGVDSIGGNPVRRLSEGFDLIAQDQQRNIDRMAKPSGLLASGIAGGVQSTVQFGKYLPLLAFGPGGGAAALVGMTAETFGGAYQDARNKGKTNVQSLIYGSSQAAIEYATEKLPVGRLMKDLGVGTPLYKTLLNQLAAEIPGEQAATLLQDLNQWAILNPEKPFSSYLDERPGAAAQTLIATIVGTGGNVALTTGIDKSMQAVGQQYVKADQAEQAAQFAAKLNQLAKASKALQRDPQAGAAFVQSLAEGGQVQDVYIDAKTFFQSAQDAGVNEADLPPVVREQLFDALARGGDLRIPIADYMTTVGKSDYADSLVDHIKTEQDGFSRAEAQEFMQSGGEALQAEVESVLAQQGMSDEFKASQEAVKDRVLGELNALGRFTPAKNEVDATLIAARTSVRAAQLGMTPEAFFEKQLARFTAEGVAGGQQFDQTGAIVTDTPRFKTWFGESKLTTEDGAPLILYHGTADNVSEFDLGHPNRKDSGWLGTGVYLTDDAGLAESYARLKAGAGNPNVMPLYARLENPYMATLEDKARLKNLGREGADAFTAELKSQGYDGVILEFDGGGREVVVFDPAGVKSQFNRGTFDPADANILNQSKNERDLIVTHNLTAENLLHANKMGGIPVPSLAITKKDTPLDGFGEITLIGDEKMADPKGYASTKVFGADIYSPRYPSIERDIDRKGMTALDKKFDAMAKRMGARLPDLQDLQRDGQRELERALPVMGQFLVEQGIEPGLVYPKTMTDEREARLQEFGLGPFLETQDAFDLMQNEAFFKAALAEMIDTYESLDGKLDAFVQKLKTDEDAQRNMVQGTAREIANAAKLRKRPEIDAYGTRIAMERQIAEAELGNEFQQYVVDQLDGITKSERIFQGFTYSGNRKYIPHTLENVVKLLKKELRGGENFNYGVGSLRAKFTPQFKSVSQIRANKDRLISAEQFNTVKDEIDAEFIQVAAAINPDLRLDTAVAIMEDAAKKGATRSAKDYGYDLTPEVAQQVGAFLDKLRNLPTAYFEAKILREVGLTEFKGAVVPSDVNPQVIEVLKGQGVTDIKTYDRNNEGDRAAKIGEFENLFFQSKTGPRGSFNPETNTIAMLKNADLSTFLHESGHYFFENDIALAAEIVSANRAFGGDTMTQGESEIVADVEALLRWHGIQGENVDELMSTWYNLSFEEKRAYHERTAESFEAYLFEGKAPSIELQPYFQKFRAYLIAVYKSLKDFLARNPEAGKLNDEVRGVFDRMIATTEQIQLAEQARSMMPLFESAQAAGMTVEEFAKYQADGIQPTQDAIEELQARALRDMQWLTNAKGREVKKLKRKSDALRREATIEARREVMSQPVYRAWQFLTGKLEKDDKAAMTPKALRKSVKGPVDETVDSLFVAIAKMGGLKRDQVASQWGWDKKQKSPVPMFGQPLVRATDGLGLDGMGELLAERGYLPLNENGNYDLNDFEEKFMAELRGDEQFSIAKQYEFDPDAMPGGDVNLQIMGAARFDSLAIRELGISPEIVEHIQNLGMVAKDGIAPDLVAEMFEFTSGDELVRTLAAAQEPKVAIQERTDQLMMERHGELATAQAISESADKAIYNEARARFVTAELNAANKAAGKPRVMAEAAKAFAAQMIARLKVRNIKPGQYAVAAARAGKAAVKASKGGDLQAVATEKRNEAINTYAAKAAYDAREEVDKALAYFKRFDRAGSRKSIDLEYLEQIDNALARIDIRKGTSLKEVDRRKSLSAWVERQRELGFEPDIDQALLDNAEIKSYKDMTMEELRGLVDAIKQIEHLGRLKNRLLTARDQREFQAIVDDVVLSIATNGGKPKDIPLEEPTGAGKTVPWLQGVWASHRKLGSLMTQFDGGAANGIMFDIFTRPMNERSGEEQLMIEQATEELAKLYAPIMAMKGGTTGDKRFIPEIGNSLSRGGRLAVALNWGNEANRQRIMQGDNWSLAQVEAILQTLSVQELEFVNQMWSFIDSYWPQVEAKQKRVYGVAPEKVQAEPFLATAADGTKVMMRGGYYPIKYDQNRSGKAESQEAAQVAQDMMRGAVTKATTRRGHTKARVENVKRPVRKSLDVITSHVTEVVHDLVWHEWLIDANKLLSNKDVEETIRTYYGPKVLSTIKDDIMGIATADVVGRTALEQGLLLLRSNVSRATMGFSFTTAFLQPFGLTNSMAAIGVKPVLRGMLRWGGDAARFESSMTWIAEKSNFMRLRAKSFNRELTEINGRVGGKSKATQVADAALFFLMTKMQMIADVPTWIGQYEKAIAQNQDEETAIALADQAVLASQGGGQIKDLAEIQRKHPFLTQFYSYFSTTLNLTVQKTANTDFKNPMAVAGWLADMAFLLVIPAIGPALIQALLRGDDLDDPEELAKMLAENQVGYLLGMVVGARELSGAVSGFGYSGPPVGRVVADLGKFAQQAGQGEVDEPAVMATIRLLGTAFGIPTVQSIRSYKGWQAWEDGEAPPSAVLFGPPRNN